MRKRTQMCIRDSSNTKKIIEDAKAKPKRYGMRINLLDSNPATRLKYLYDAVGMTPAGMNFAGGGFDYGDWGDIWYVKKNRPVMVRTCLLYTSQKMESFGKKMSVVSAGIAAIGVASIAAFKELDEGYDTIVTKTGATGEALEGLTASADNVFGSMPERCV